MAFVIIYILHSHKTASFGNNSYMNNVLLYPMVFGVCGVKNNQKVSLLIKANGRIEVDGKKSVKINKNYNIFLLRGIIFLFLGLYNVINGLFYFNGKYAKKNKYLLKSASSLNVSKSGVLGFFILIISILLSGLVLGLLPLKISFYLAPKNYNIVVKRLVVAIIKLVIVYLTFLLLKTVNVFKEYYKFNSAIKQIQKSQKQINFLEYFVCSVFLCLLILSVFGMTLAVWYGIFVNVFLCLLVFGLNYEIFKIATNKKWFFYITFPFCFLTYQKPSQKEIKCVNILLKQLEQNKTGDKMEQAKEQILFSEAYVTLKEKLEKAGKFDASDLDFIFCEILGKNRSGLKLLKTINCEDYKKAQDAVNKRCKGMPIDIIFGKTNFYGLDFIVTKDVLCPRIDTEVLVEQVIKNCNTKSKVLDIGTGSGAIAITIAKEAGAKVTAVDISDKALEVAKQNAKLNGVSVTFKKSNLFEGLSKINKFDIIVSNPPYIPSADIEELDEEVKNYDPMLALDGGISGLDFYERIIADAPKYLKANGMIFFEVGIGQAGDVKKLLEKDFKEIKIVKDYGKVERVVLAIIK